MQGILLRLPDISIYLENKNRNQRSIVEYFQ